MNDRKKPARPRARTGTLRRLAWNRLTEEERRVFFDALTVGLDCALPMTDDQGALLLHWLASKSMVVADRQIQAYQAEAFADLEQRLTDSIRQAAWGFAKTGANFGAMDGMFWAALTALGRHIDHDVVTKALREEYGPATAGAYATAALSFCTRIPAGTQGPIDLPSPSSYLH